MALVDLSHTIYAGMPRIQVLPQRDIMAAATLVTAMEEAAEMELDAPPIGGAKPFPEGALEAVRERLRQFHG